MRWWALGSLLLAASHAATVELSTCSMISSSFVYVNGSVISSPEFVPTAWYNVSLPATVMAGLVQNSVYPDPFYSENLKLIPTNIFDVPWWYRCTFTAPNDGVSFITFQGINYKANVWLDGEQVGNVSSIVGTFISFDFPVTSTSSSEHVVAVEVFRPHDRTLGTNVSFDLDLAISFVDWAPYSPDSNMVDSAGLWQPVLVTTLDSSVAIRDPSVVTTLPSDAEARLDIAARLTNFAASPVHATLTGSIDGGTSFSQQVDIPADSSITVWFNYSTVPALILTNPLLWWPWQMGPPNLHNLSLTVQTAGTSTLVPGVQGGVDSITTSFGIRTVTSELDQLGHRLYRVNNRSLLIRGAGWSPDMFLRLPLERLATEMDYVRHMNLNTIRMEGKFERDAFYAAADARGLLIMTGWCCCDAWQRWGAWTPDLQHVATNSMASLMRRLRIHPSILAFLYGSDELAPIQIERQFLAVAAAEAWSSTLLSSASARSSSATGPTGVKMSGPYSWVPPVYWLEDTHRLGGAFGFLTEGGPGEAPMVLDSLTRTLPGDDLWPAGPAWDWHSANPIGVFRNLRFFNPPLLARYGNASSAAEYLIKAQAAQYESHRAFFEGYSRNKYTATGFIQWMLNNAWPENVWHLYDWYLQAGGSYYAARKACEPLHAIFSYNDGSVWLVNSVYQPWTDVVLSIQLRNVSGDVVWQNKSTSPLLCADCTLEVLTLPTLPTTTTYFLRLEAQSGSTVSLNDYWLSTVPDVLDWNNSTFYTTFCTSYADLTQLSTLKPVSLQLSAHQTNPTTVGPSPANAASFAVSITNPAATPAFMVRLRATLHGLEVLPALWDDNYLILFENDSRTVNVSFPGLDASLVAEVVFSYEVWNNIVTSPRLSQAN